MKLSRFLIFCSISHITSAYNINYERIYTTFILDFAPGLSEGEFLYLYLYSASWLTTVLQLRTSASCIYSWRGRRNYEPTFLNSRALKQEAKQEKELSTYEAKAHTKEIKVESQIISILLAVLFHMVHTFPLHLYLPGAIYQCSAPEEKQQRTMTIKLKKENKK